MATAGEAADFGQPATSHPAEVSSSSSPDLGMCNECHPKLVSAELFCPNCEASLCRRCDEDVVHNSRTARGHPRMEIKDYLLMKRGLGDSSPTDAQLEVDDKNKFIHLSPMDHCIILRPRLASLVHDPDARPSLVAFIGPTGVGKSTLMRILLSLDGGRDAGDMPLAGAPSDAQSTSADIHMYAGGQVTLSSSAGESSYPLLYVDSEGLGGSKEPRGVHIMWNNVRKVCGPEFHPGGLDGYRKRRYEHAQVSYPRLLYIFSDVLCFVFQGSWREREAILKPLLEWGQSAAAGAANQHRPRLILIFNKMGSEFVDAEFDDYQKTYKKWIEKDEGNRLKDLQRYYSDPLVCLIPHLDANVQTIVNRVRRLGEVIASSSKQIRTSREQSNQLFTRRELQVHMQLAADTFTKNPNGEFDLYQASLSRRPASGLAGYITEFRRAVENANSQCTSKSERYGTSLVILQNRITWSVLLHIGRQDVKVRLGRGARLPKDLQSSLKQAQRVIDGEMPCSAHLFRHTAMYKCDTLRLLHGGDEGHSSKQTVDNLAVRWEGEFESNIDECRLVSLAERALGSRSELDVKEIWQKLLEVRESEHVAYKWLESSSFYGVCVICIVELPTEVLSCGHIICAKCAKEGAMSTEEAAISSSRERIIDLTCPVCLLPAKWFPMDLPPLAGCRILSLDGGGVRGIVELLSLQKIMSFYPDSHVEHLFDIVIGTSTGGIIALALTVHELNKEPKRLGTVIELFQTFCRKVFSREALRTFGDITVLRLIFQFLRIYDTKYKNKNLLELLEDHFGGKLLLRSCVGGPRVIITACDRDNDLAAAWFTSYNRPVLENDSKVAKQVVKAKTDSEATSRVSGRVADNHLFNVKDVAAATSAAGTYFPAYKAHNRFWIDGGFRFNGPAAIAIQEARIMWPNRKQTVLSLGCGSLSYEGKDKSGSDSFPYYMKSVVDVLTDAESQFNNAMLLLQTSECGLRLNPTIHVPKGKNCELDSAESIQLLMDETQKYLDSTDGCKVVENAVNLLLAALFYVDVEIDQDSLQPKLDMLRIRSRAALPQLLRDALIAASSSVSPPFCGSVEKAPGAICEFFWRQCTWVQNFMNLPFKLSGLPVTREVTVNVKLHMCHPETTVSEGWSLDISGMPCKLYAAV